MLRKRKKIFWIIKISLLLLFVYGCGKSNDQLIKELSSDNPQTRLNAASALLGRQGDKDAVAKVRATLNGKDDRSAFIAIQILASMADTSVIADIGKMLNHSNPNIRLKAVQALGGIGYASAIPYIIEALKDKNSNVRYEAVDALGTVYELSAIKYIYPLLRDDIDSVRVAAIQSIYTYRHVKESGVLAADLAPLLSDTSERVRFVCVQALGGGFVDSTLAGDLLLEALNDDSKFVRKEAIISIKNIRYLKALPILKEMFYTASIEEEYEISDAVKIMTGKEFPQAGEANKSQPEN